MKTSWRRVIDDDLSSTIGSLWASIAPCGDGCLAAWFTSVNSADSSAFMRTFGSDGAPLSPVKHLNAPSVVKFGKLLLANHFLWVTGSGGLTSGLTTLNLDGSPTAIDGLGNMVSLALDAGRLISAATIGPGGRLAVAVCENYPNCLPMSVAFYDCP